ncbi:MAG: MFS transporter [Litorimonas sp.]
MSAPAQDEDRFAAFRHNAFKRYFWARFLTASATQIVATAVGFQLWTLTKDAWLLGLIGLVQFLPALILVLATGLAADVFGRRRVMGLAIILKMACALGILILSITGQFLPVLVLSILTLFGVARAFHTPASSSLVVNVVPNSDFANAVGWITSSWQLASIVGPAIGGLLYYLSATLAYSSAVVIFGISATLIFSLEKPNQEMETGPTNWKTLVGGFRYIWQEKIVLGAISLDLFAILLGGAVALLPIYAEDILNVGSIGNGLLRAAPGIGAMIMVAFLIRFPVRDHAGTILLLSVAGFGAATAVFGVSKIAWLSIIMLALLGAFDMVSVYIREILIQLWTPDRVRGRVNAVNAIFLGASNELGEFRAGAMAAVYGAVFTVAAGGAAAMGVAGLWRVLFPKMSRTRKLEAPEHLKE